MGETWEVSEAKVKAVIKEKLQIDVDIERAHRVERRKSGKKQNTNQPRTVSRACMGNYYVPNV